MSQRIEEPFSVHWKDVKVTAKVKGKTKEILHSVNGHARSGEVLAIVGASGSGKTTLLNYLSGFIGQDLKTSGSIYFGEGFKVTNTQVRAASGYVLQEDIAQSQLTVTENLLYSAKFRFSDMTGIEETLNKIIETLCLEKCRNTKIGSDLERGVSGGEKKRCCIGMELVHEPPVMFLDEPTTGLDSLSSENVVNCMKSLAKQNKAVICTIHQPSTDLLEMFDKILIIHQGSVICHSSYSEMKAFFRNHQVAIPEFVNNVEYILTALNMNEANCTVLKETAPENKFYNWETVKALKDGCQSAKEALLKESQAFEGVKISNNTQSTLQEYMKPKRVSFCRSFKVQMSRSFKNYFRNRRIFLAQLAANIFYIILAVILFRNLGLGPKGIQNRLGVLFYLTLLGILTVTQITSMAFSSEVIVLRKELLQGLYTPLSYFFGVSLPQDIPMVCLMVLASLAIYFVSALNRNSPAHILNALVLVFGCTQAGEGFGHLLAAIFVEREKIIAMLPTIIMPLQLFSGFFLGLSVIPWVVRWISYLNVFRYSLEGLVANEFGDLECEAPIDCHQVIIDKGYNESVLFSILKLFGLSLAMRILSVLIFHLRYRKYSSKA